MADFTTSELITTFLKEDALDATQKDSIREDLGLKTTDAVTFKNLVLTALSLTGSQATSSLDIVATWNTTGTPTALKVNVTDTASDAASLFLDFQIGGASKYNINKVGSCSGGTYSDGGYTLSGGAARFSTWKPNSSADFEISQEEIANYKPSIKFVSMGRIVWSSNNDWCNDTLKSVLDSPSAATFRLGQDHATTPTAQTLKAHNVTTGTGADLTLSGGTGSVANGNVILYGGNRVAMTAISNIELYQSLFNHGLLTPPLNEPAETPVGSEELDSLTLSLNSANAEGILWLIETQVSDDNATWENNSSGAEDGSGGGLEITVSGLSPETVYFIRWRSVAPNNSSSSEWSASVEGTTVTP